MEEPAVSGRFAGESDVGRLAFVNDFTSIQVIDVENPAAPFRRSSYSSGFKEMSKVFYAHGRPYLCGMVQGFWGPNAFYTIDISNPDALRLCGSYTSFPGNEDPSEVCVSNGLAYFVSWGLYALDVTNPSSASLRGYYPSGFHMGTPQGLFVSGNRIYMTDFMGLRIFEYTGPSASARRWSLYR